MIKKKIYICLFFFKVESAGVCLLLTKTINKTIKPCGEVTREGMMSEYVTSV